MNNKKAEIGIGTLIIFIAMILVAAIAAGVLLQTAGSLQNKALLTGERSKTQVSTALTTNLLFGENGNTNQDLEYLCQKLKLQPGSDAIKFSDTLVEIQTKNASSSIVYGREMGAITATAASTGLDFDADGTADTLNLSTDCGGGSNECITLTMSTAGEANYSLGSNLAAAGTTAVEVALFQGDFNVSGTQYGVVSVFGETGTNDQLDASVYVIIAVAGEGSDSGYSVDYLINGSLNRNGYLNRGDMVKLCYMPPRDLVEDETIEINIIPKTGAVHTIETALPDVMTNKRIYIYP